MNPDLWFERSKRSKQEAELVMADMFSLEEQLLRARSIEWSQTLRHYRLSKHVFRDQLLLLSEQWRILSNQTSGAKPNQIGGVFSALLSSTGVNGSNRMPWNTGFNLSCSALDIRWRLDSLSYLNPALRLTCKYGEHKVQSNAAVPGITIAQRHSERPLPSSSPVVPFPLRAHYRSDASLDVLGDWKTHQNRQPWACRALHTLPNSTCGRSRPAAHIRARGLAVALLCLPRTEPHCKGEDTDQGREEQLAAEHLLHQRARSEEGQRRPWTPMMHQERRKTRSWVVPSSLWKTLTNLASIASLMSSRPIHNR